MITEKVTASVAVDGGAGALQEAVRGRLRTADDLGDLADREVVHDLQQQRFPLRLRQARQQLPHLLPRLFVLDRLFRQLPDVGRQQ